MSIIDEALLRDEENRRIRAAKTLYVTDLTSPCMREAYFDILLDKPAPLESLRVFEAGNLIEDYWLQVLANNPRRRILARQLPVHINHNNYEIHGRIDALVQHDEAEIVVHEVKSAKSCNWLKEPHADHLAQLCFYMTVLGVSKGEINYLDKTSLLEGDASIDLTFKIDKKTEVESNYWSCLENAETLIKALEAKTLPTPTPCYLCQSRKLYCQYKEECEKEAKE